MRNDEVYAEICNKICRYMHPPTLDLLDRCAVCAVSRLTGPPPWYAWPDYSPPLGTTCLLVNFDGGETSYKVATYGPRANGFNAFLNPVFSNKQPPFYPSAWQPIQPPAYLIQKPHRK